VKRIIDSMENSRIKDYLRPNSLIKDESIKEVKFIRFDSPDVPFVLYLKDHLEQLHEMKEILRYFFETIKLNNHAITPLSSNKKVPFFVETKKKLS
jgi:hypothetical protein